MATRSCARWPLTSWVKQGGVPPSKGRLPGGAVAQWLEHPTRDGHLPMGTRVAPGSGLRLFPNSTPSLSPACHFHRPVSVTGRPRKMLWGKKEGFLVAVTTDQNWDGTGTSLSQRACGLHIGFYFMKNHLPIQTTTNQIKLNQTKQTDYDIHLS